MGQEFFLGNPHLTVEDVVATHSSAIGRRAGQVIPAVSNGGQMLMTAFGDAGDGLSRLVQIRGNEDYPRYLPHDTSAVPLFSGHHIFAAAPTHASVATGCAVAASYDRLHLVTIEGDFLLVYTKGLTTWTLRNSIEMDHDASGGLSAWGEGDMVWIAVADNVGNTVYFYQFSAITFALREVANGSVTTTAPDHIALASNGSRFVLLVENDVGGGIKDTKVFFGGDLSRMEEKGDSFIDMFGTTWNATPGDIKKPALMWSPYYQFVAALHAQNGSPGNVRVVRSNDGDDWTEFTGNNGVVAHPPALTGANYANGKTLAIVAEAFRIWIFETTTTGAAGTAPTDVKTFFFDGRDDWEAEVDADGGVAIQGASPLAATNWRGTVYFAWLSTSSVAVRKCNELTTTDSDLTGPRGIDRGRRNFVAGIDDDSRTALFFKAKGFPQKGDEFTIPVQFDHDGKYILTEFTAETWRAVDGVEQYDQLYAGLGRRFLLDTFCLFNTNVPEVLVEMDSAGTMAAPSFSTELSAVLKTRTITSATVGAITFAADSFVPHEFANRRCWVRVGASILTVLDNTASMLVVDGDATALVGDADVFGDRLIYKHPTLVASAPYIRFTVEAMDVPDGYFQIGKFIGGIRLEPEQLFYTDYSRRTEAHGEILEVTSGARLGTRLNYNARRAWDIRYPAPLPNQVVATRGYLGRFVNGQGQLAFSQDGDLEGLTLCRVVSDLDEKHVIEGRMALRLRIEEEI